MSYYGRSSSESLGWGGIMLCILMVIFITLGQNACTASTWNNGKCPDCSVRYELRGASRGVKYYACPECGQEVERW